MRPVSTFFDIQLSNSRDLSKEMVCDKMFLRVLLCREEIFIEWVLRGKMSLNG